MGEVVGSQIRLACGLLLTVVAIHRVMPFLGWCLMNNYRDLTWDDDDGDTVVEERFDKRNRKRQDKKRKPARQAQGSMPGGIRQRRNKHMLW